MDSETARLFDRMGADAQRIAERIQGVSGSGSDDEQLVTATCGPGNRLIGIEFDPRSRRLDTHVLAEKVLTAVQRAGDAAQAQLMGYVNDFSAGFGGMRDSDMGGLQRSMGEAQARIAEQRARLEQLAEQLKSAP